MVTQLGGGGGGGGGVSQKSMSRVYHVLAWVLAHPTLIQRTAVYKDFRLLFSLLLEIRLLLHTSLDTESTCITRHYLIKLSTKLLSKEI